MCKSDNSDNTFGHIPVKSSLTFLDVPKWKFPYFILWRKYLSKHNIPEITWWVGPLVHQNMSTVSVCVFRTQQPGVESPVEGHVSSQNHMQSCWQDPDHVGASRLNTTEQTRTFVTVSLSISFTHVHTHTYTHIRDVSGPWQVQKCFEVKDLTSSQHESPPWPHHDHTCMHKREKKTHTRQYEYSYELIY